MCGRYNLKATPAEIQEFFDLFRAPDWSPRYNIAPTQDVLAIRFDEQTTPREPVKLRWGLIPFWADDPKIGSRMINARADTAAAKPAFRAAFKRRRCLIPATGFYEWQKTTAKTKQPYHISRDDGQPFAFAGLWERWDKGPAPIESCTILTTDANDDMQPIHDRMPVILQPDDYDLWLAPHEDPAALQGLLVPYAGSDLQFTRISTLVNNPRSDSPECLQPID